MRCKAVRNVAIVVFDRVYQLGIAAVTDTLQIANRFIGNRIGHEAAVCAAGAEARHISVRLLSLDGKSVLSSCGLPVLVENAVDAVDQPLDLIVIPAVEYADYKIFAGTLKKMQALGPWLCQQHTAGAVLAGHGTGVFALAEAGLLDHRVASIGHLLEKIFHRRYPAVRLKPDQSITEANGIFCAGGLAAALPLMEHLVQRFTSPMIALQTRRALQLDESAEESPPEYPQEQMLALEHELVEKAQYWLQQNLANKTTLAELADYVAVSERTLIRQFKQILGTTPHAYLQSLRMETAKRFLDRTDLRIDAVAERVGYTNVAFFRRSFRAYIGSTPTAYRSGRTRRAPH